MDVIDFVAGQTKAQPNEVFAGSVPYLMLAGNMVAGWQMARALLAAEKHLAASTDPQFMRAKIATARFYAASVLPQAAGIARAVTHGGEATLELAAEHLRNAQASLSELTGELTSDDLLGEIFATFCIGK